MKFLFLFQLQDVESPSPLPAGLQDNSSVQGAAVQRFPAGCSGGPSRAAASARDVPEGLVLVLGNAFACPGSGCGAGCDLAEPQR